MISHNIRASLLALPRDAHGMVMANGISRQGRYHSGSSNSASNEQLTTGGALGPDALPHAIIRSRYVIDDGVDDLARDFITKVSASCGALRSR